MEQLYASGSVNDDSEHRIMLSIIQFYPYRFNPSIIIEKVHQ